MDALPLTMCALNRTLVIESVGERDKNAARKLAALGLVKGRKIRLLQKRFAYVISCEYTQVAVDRAVAGMIMVKPQPPGQAFRLPRNNAQ